MTTEANTAAWRPKAIIFDLLTALMDSWTLWDKSTPSGTKEEGLRWRKRYLELTFGRGAYVPYADLVHASARESGLPVSAAEKLLQDWEQLKPWPETNDVLDKLRDRGYKLGVVTNCSKQLGHAAAHFWNGTWDAVVTAEESGYYKPVDKAYQAALTAFGLDAGDVLFVAGSAGDVEGATKAGMRVIWHNRIGLPRLGGAEPLKEGKSLDDALRDFL